ncbi:MAG: TRM11 family SAM-dependent methyltransferase [Lutisporaceae bacterium]|jgi:hypothetical protein
MNTNQIYKSILDKSSIDSSTHDFYRYPARFSPSFAKAIIENFTEPNDWILDPFMGGGTTLVEASLLGRHAIGTDISSLAVFLARVKTTCYSKDELDNISSIVFSIVNKMNIHMQCVRATKWLDYQRNINTKKTWRIRKLLEQALYNIDTYCNEKEERFIRCVLLKTAQWALDCRYNVPSVKEFRNQLLIFLTEMISKAKDYSEIINTNFNKDNLPHAITLHRSAIDLEKEEIFFNIPAPKLILTSPPYPGVHVLYHRWQVISRKETPAPFWIANCYDGHPGSYYTMGNRKEKYLNSYFENLKKAFQSLIKLASKETIFVQMVAFSDHTWQLEQYLNVIDTVGLNEIKYPQYSNSSDGRIWREVPNRKWYAQKKGNTSSSLEVTLFHKIK